MPSLLISNEVNEVNQAPPGYRLLFQDVESRTQEESLVLITRAFGQAKAKNAISQAGVWRPKSKYDVCGELVFHERGFRWFVPTGGKFREYNKDLPDPLGHT